MVFPIIPPWKRARYAKPEEPKSLRDLAMDAFIEELQYQLVVDVSKIPAEFGDDIWDKMTTCEIIQTALNSNAVDWFSENVISEPKSMTVGFPGSGDFGSVELKFQHRETLLWRFEKPSKNKKNKHDNDNDEWFDIKIGDHVLKTRVDWFASQNRYNTDAIVSVLPSTDFKVRYDIVQWLCGFFRCKVEKFEFEDSKLCSYWNFVEEPGDLKIERCTDLDFANRVLPERQRKNLSTSVSRFRIDEPIRITAQSIQQARINTAFLNFTTSDFDTITSFYKELIPKVRIICTKVLNWTADQLETFKSELGLEDYSDELLETYRAEKFMEDSEQKWYKLLEIGYAVVVYVNEKEPEVYDQIGCTRWYKKV
ncbi:hypothetical protein CAEBREN_15200 [Caenorhabditis brenneri]|uniref:Uncharacterized protein n=1 Tax=Caenorhabditis brenneri TaxID=135651 RepID=G0MIT9_CAEBE|nr:hypothetical protein CAEBREN_15200 [Caenorhabditis brenneri]